jgi:hypothetical protein
MTFLFVYSPLIFVEALEKKEDITRVLVHGNNGFLFSDIKGFMGLIR